MQDADRLEVELVGVPVRLGHAKVVQDGGEPPCASPDRPAQPQPDGV